MKETREMTFRFTDKEPEEWEFIMSLCRPFATTKVDKKNLDVALAWFGELCITLGLKVCDRILLELLESPETFLWVEDRSKFLFMPIETAARESFQEEMHRLLVYTTKCVTTT